MTSTQLRNFYDAAPFQPFTIRWPDGRALPVKSKEFIWITPNGRIVVVANADDSVNVIDMLMITDLEIRSGVPTPEAGNGQSEN